MTTKYMSAQNSKETLTTLVTTTTETTDSAEATAHGNSIQLNSTKPKTKVNSQKMTSQCKSRQNHIPLRKGRRESFNRGKIWIWMTALFIISWGPLTFYALIIATTEFEGTINLSTAFYGLASANSILNPIIYFAKRDNLRCYFLKFYCRKHH